ncbi:MAG: DUF3365 domain-containing protein [Actinobacteria bacterium]|nr:DUF3365 domain-containing protein [Actinomycetota bacterium]
MGKTGAQKVNPMVRKMSISTRIMIGITIIVVAVMSLGFVWDIRLMRQMALEEFKAKAQVIAEELVAIRAVAAHNQDKINRDSSGNFEFKHLNPAVWGRQIATIFNTRTEYVLKQTRLAPRVSDNAPDDTERSLLQSLSRDRGLKEIWVDEERNGVRLFRYMVPLETEMSCLPCHGTPAGEKDVAGYPKEGLKVGDLAGAISVTVPMERFEAELRKKTMMSLGVTALMVGLSLGMIFVVMNNQVTGPLGRLAQLAAEVGHGNWQKAAEGFRGTGRSANGEIKDLTDALVSMARQLKESYSLLESKVAQRTADLKEANRQLSAANLELQKASQFKSEFLANVSHELRTPLTAINALAEILLDPDSGELSGMQKEYLEDVLESGQELLVMINELLDLAKIEAGRMELYRDLVDPEAVVDRAIEIVTPLARKKGVSVVKEWGKIPWLFIDGKKALRVIVNLLSNAVKFTPGGGIITVSGGVAQIDDHSGVLVAVADTGPGIDPGHLDAVFDKFWQAGGGPSNGVPGTGLGLALAKHLVELHGGRIWVESERGRGSTFKVFFPIETGEASGRCPHEPDCQDSSRGG